MTNLPVLTFQSVLLKRQELGPGTLSFTFTVPEEFDFVPGQFVMLKIMGADSKPVRRAFSICSYDRESHTIELCIKILEDGRLTKPLSLLADGAKVDMQGPYGKFVLLPSSKKILLVAAGTGIAPLRAMYLDLLANSSPSLQNPIELIFGFHAPEDYLYQREIEDLTSAHHNFSAIPVCSTPDTSWTAKTGHVQDIIMEQYPDGEEYQAYVCGPPKMVAQTCSLLLKKGFKEIHKEAWG